MAASKKISERSLLLFLINILIILNQIHQVTSKNPNNLKNRFGTQFGSSTTPAFALPDIASSINPTTLAIQIFSASSAYFGLIATYDRPRGELSVNADDDLLVAKSAVANGGLGLYTKTSFPKGKILGTYPGVVRPIAQNMEKLKEAPSCESYVWRFGDNKMIIDPTNDEGKLDDDCLGGSIIPLSKFLFQTILNNWRVSTTLARINEPPRGYDCNVETEEDIEKRIVIFRLSRDVVTGEELFMDYGITYDRSNYNKPSDAN